MNHKYVNRITGKTIYLGPAGKTIFDTKKESKNFVYMGEISKEEQEKEEQSKQKNNAEILSDAAEKEKRNSELTETVKRKADELTQEQLDALTAEKKIVIDETPETPETPESIDEKSDEEKSKSKSKKKSDEQKEK